MWSKEDLLSTAILGTGQQELPPFNSDSASERLQDLGKQIELHSAAKGKELTLLRARALSDLFEKAAMPAQKFTGQMPLADLETSKLAPASKLSSKAKSQLNLLLEFAQELLPEWLELAKQHGKFLPPESLVRVLDLGLKKESLRPAIKAVAGPRALWLAALNRSWSYLLESENENTESSKENLQEIWETGQSSGRLQALRTARRLEPEFGLQLLVSSWNSDPLDERLAFLPLLEPELSSLDEGFLEQALEDKRKEIRSAAQKLLRQLPASAYSKRNKERLLRILNISRAEQKQGFMQMLNINKKNKFKLEAQLPQECDKDMLKDGFSNKSPDARMGDRAWILCQLIGLVDPDFLLRHFELSNEELLQIFFESEWSFALLSGLEESLLRFGRRQLALLLLDSNYSDYNLGKYICRRPVELFCLLARQDKEELMSKILKAKQYLLFQTGADSYTLEMIKKIDGPWSKSFSQEILKTLRTHMTQKNNSIFFDHLLGHIARCLDIKLWSALEESWRSCASYDRALERMLATLSLRKEVAETLAQTITAKNI